MARARNLDFYDQTVCELIVEKYGIDERTAVRSFIESEAYRMLLDPETALDTVSPHILFDMWECEKIAGDPRNSQYIREPSA